MSTLSQIPTDYKKYFDQTLHAYLPKVCEVRNLFNSVNVDPASITPEYVRQTQTYDASKGWTSFSDPEVLADGARAKIDSIGTEDATGTVVTYAKGFRIDRKLLNSGNQLVKQYITKHTVEYVNIIENYVNRTLITNMASNAGQTYTATGGTWSTTGDPAEDIFTAQENFRMASGGMAADFLLLHPNEYKDLKTDTRFQSTLYTATTPLATGNITPKPFGLDIIVDQSVTTGTFFIGKKGMFADLLISENYVSYEWDEAEAGKAYSMVFSFVDQYKLPYYLMYGTGI